MFNLDICEPCCRQHGFEFIEHCGATPILVDIEPDTLNLDPALVLGLRGGGDLPEEDLVVEGVRVNSLILGFEVASNFDYETSDEIASVVGSLEEVYTTGNLQADVIDPRC